MAHNVLKTKTDIFPQNQQHHPPKIQMQRENANSLKLWSKKKQSDKVVRRVMPKNKLKTVKLRSTRSPHIPLKVLRVLKILRHEKFLNMVQKYFAPVNTGNVNDSASRRSIYKDSLVGEA